ncbi:helix-turn-helix domain-containing protein [Haloferacaceae archaeon DSL9]
MSVRVEFSVPARAFLLGDAVESDPHLRAELDRAVPLCRAMVPVLRVERDDRSRFEQFIDTDPSISTFEFVAQTKSELLYRVEWMGAAERLAVGLTRSHATPLESRLRSRRWRFVLWFSNPEHASSFQRYCRDYEIPLRVSRVTTDDPRSTGDRLTEKQRVAMQVAYDRGYFACPRETDLRSIGRELDISSQAVSQRLRRATARLIEQTVARDRYDTEHPQD